MSNRHREVISKEPCTPLCCSMGEPEALSGSPPWGWAVPFRFNTIESHQLCKILWSPLVFSRCVNGTSLKGWRSGQVAEHLPRMHWVLRPPLPQHSFICDWTGRIPIWAKRESESLTVQQENINTFQFQEKPQSQALVKSFLFHRQMEILNKWPKLVDRPLQF